MNKDCKKLVDHILAHWPRDAPPRHIELILSELAASVLGLSPDVADEFAEAHAEEALDALIADIDRERPVPHSPRVALLETSPDQIQGSSFFGSAAPAEDRKAKTRRLQHDPMLAYLQQMSWEQFELCCRGMLAILGCDNPAVTRLGNDQGIDFYGKLPLRGRLANASLLSGIDDKLEVWMVGQAKHYQKTKVSTPDLRELVGSVQLARSKTFADGGVALADLNMRLCDPTFYLFFTTGAISADGQILLTQSGVIGMDGSAVATFLVDNGVGEFNGEFDAAEMDVWLSRQRVE